MWVKLLDFTTAEYLLSLTVFSKKYILFDTYCRSTKVYYFVFLFIFS